MLDDANRLMIFIFTAIQQIFLKHIFGPRATQSYELSYALNKFYCRVDQNQLYSRIYRLQYNSEFY